MYVYKFSYKRCCTDNNFENIITDQIWAKFENGKKKIDLMVLVFLKTI